MTSTRETPSLWRGRLRKGALPMRGIGLQDRSGDT